MKSRKLFYFCSFLIALFSIIPNSSASTRSPSALKPPTKTKKAIKPNSIKQRPSETLPQNLSREQFLQHIANELGWVTAKRPCSLCDGYYKEPGIVGKHPHPPGIKEQPTTITAKGTATFEADGVSVLQKNVVVTQVGRIIKADKAYIYRNDKTGKITKVKLIGHIRMLEAGKLIVADKGTVTLYPKTAILINSAYHVYSEDPYSTTLKGPFNAWGTAQRAAREPSGVITLDYATYTVCTPTNPAWEIAAKKVTIDKKNNVGKAYNAVVFFKHIPILFSPYYSFPLNRERKTGFLTPRLGYNNRSGAQFGFPFYWNMAPNYDLTITPQYLTKRNFDINAYFRYISRHSTGNIFIDYIPNDTAFEEFRSNAGMTYSNAVVYNQTFFAPYLRDLSGYKNQRAFISMSNTTSFDDDWSANLYVNYVTDPYYFQDFAGTIKIGSSTLVDQLLNRADLKYTGWHWNFKGLAQGYQTLHQINQTQNPALDQYTRLPDLSTDAYYSLPLLDFDLNMEYVYFTYQSNFTPNKPIGQRLHLRPGLSFPIYFDGDYFIPQVWLDTTSYQVEHRQPNQVADDTRLLPIVDIDSGFYFDHNFRINKKVYTQTFEPHLYYLYIPYKNQDQLPNFDTVLLPFSFEQLFAINHFTGLDRIDNANQISLGLTSRILSDSSQILTANLGIAYYFDPSRVCLTAGCTPSDQHWSPLTADLAYYFATHWSLSGNIAWDPNQTQTNNGQASITYSRDAKHSVSLSYLFVRGNGASIAPSLLTIPNNVYSTDTSEVVFSFTWPLTKKWSTVGSWSYNIVHDRSDNYFAGLQYDTCCWALRLVVQRAYVGSTVDNGHIRNRYDNTYFFQLQLKGLADLGTVSISQLLEKSYQKFNLIN